MAKGPIGCGYPGKGDLSHEGGEGPCVGGSIEVLILTPESKRRIVSRLCPQCWGKWRGYFAAHRV